MRRALVLGLLIACSCALVASPARAATGVRPALDALLASGQIDQAARDRYRGSYDAAQDTLTRLRGRRLTELKAVVANVDAAQKANQLIPSRLLLLFTTLDANRRQWTSGALLPYGRRLVLPGSELVWQSYPGQGIQIQWLATFGRANGLFTGGHRYDARLGRLLDEAGALATQRAGGIAWEYAFRFDGGRPPWVSALATGTALQAYSRAAIRLDRPQLFDVARQALGVFRAAPPEGIRQPTPAGARELIYSFAPKLHVLNAFVQAVNGLHDFARLANDTEGVRLFTEAEAQLRAELPSFDTGAWSMYSRQRESDLGYHVLLRDFLRTLCTKLTDDRADGGTLDPAIYCDTAAAFTRDLTTKPKLALQDSGRPRIHTPAVVRFTLDKVSVVTVAVSRAGVPISSVTQRLGRGRHTVGWGRPSKLGPVAIAITATDLAGNTTTARGALTVRR